MTTIDPTTQTLAQLGVDSPEKLRLCSMTCVPHSIAMQPRTSTRLMLKAVRVNGLAGKSGILSQDYATIG